MEPGLSRNLALVDRFDALACAAGLTSAQTALGWLMAQGDDLVPIARTRSIAHLEENLASATPAMPGDRVSAIGVLFPPNALSGPRYPAAMQAQVDTELMPDEELAVD